MHKDRSQQEQSHKQGFAFPKLEREAPPLPGSCPMHPWRHRRRRWCGRGRGADARANEARGPNAASSCLPALSPLRPPLRRAHL